MNIKTMAGLATLVLASSLVYGCIADTMSQKKLHASDPSSGLQAGLRSVADLVSVGDRAEVLFYLENIGEIPVRLLPWNTPLESELTADVFDISLAGVPLDYQGIMIKRAAATDADYITVAVGERREVVVDLSASYDMTAAGSYQVKLRTFGDEVFFRLNAAQASIAGDIVTIVRE